MSQPDPMGALAVYLRAALPDLNDRVYRPELSKGQSSAMPEATIVIRPAGGYTLFRDTNAPIGDPNLDLYCYGSTWFEAEQLANSTIPILRQLRTGTYRSTRLYWARIAGGPLPVQDPETNWPCSLLTVQLAFREVN